MVRKRVVIEFRPGDNPKHLLLHQHLSGLNAGISGSILEAIDDKFLWSATVSSGASLLEIEMVSLHSIAKLNAQIETIRGTLEAIKSQRDRGDRSTPTPDSNISFDADDEGNDDDDDDDYRIPSVDIQFKSERN
jgi:hypothetical protein